MRPASKPRKPISAEALQRQRAPLTRMPIVSAAHGAPASWRSMGTKGAELRAWGRSDATAERHSRPQAPTGRRATPRSAPPGDAPAPLRSFRASPRCCRRITYAALRAPDLAARVRGSSAAGKVTVARSPDRKLDHGAGSRSSTCILGGADIPVLQLSSATRAGGSSSDLEGAPRAARRRRDARSCAPASSSTTCAAWTSERRIRRCPGPKEFDYAWCEDVLRPQTDFAALVQFRVRAPGVSGSLIPTEEHFLPLLVAAGA